MNLNIVSQKAVVSWQFWLLVALVLPLGVTLGEAGGKPIIFDISSVALPFLVAAKLCWGKVQRKTLLILLLLTYFPILSMISAISRGGEISPIVSAASFMLPVTHIFSGFALSRLSLRDVLIVVARTFAIIVIALALTDLLTSPFLRGCGYEGRWGGCLGPFEVFGFVNASANYLAILSPLLVYLYLCGPRRGDRIIARIGFILLIIICFLSLSRSASLLIIISTFSVAAYYFGIIFPFVFAIFSLLFFYFFSEVISSDVVSGVVARTRNAIEAGDITTGRIGIWADAFNAALEMPLFGQAFMHFSEISEYGTTHQQYLEVLFKAGFLGFFIYFGVLVYGCVLMFRRLRCECLPAWPFGLLVFLTLISCFFQPIISYHTFGGLVFFLTGYVLERRGDS